MRKYPKQSFIPIFPAQSAAHAVRGHRMGDIAFDSGRDQRLDSSLFSSVGVNDE